MFLCLMRKGERIMFCDLMRGKLWESENVTLLVCVSVCIIRLSG